MERVPGWIQRGDIVVHAGRGSAKMTREIAAIHAEQLEKIEAARRANVPQVGRIATSLGDFSEILAQN